MINNKHVRTLLAGAAESAYDLPPRLLALGKLAEDLPHPIPPEPRVPNAADLGKADAARYVRGDSVPDSVAELVAGAERDHAAWVVDRQYLVGRSQAAEALIVDEILGAADEVIAALQPAHSATVVGLKKAAEILPEDATAEAVLRSNSEPMRKAWTSLASLSRRYAAIRNAVACLRQPPPKWDERGEFSEMKNLRDLWPGAGRIGGRSLAPNDPPWVTLGMDPTGRLLWLVRRGADLWCPTVEQRDKAWWAVYGEGVEQQRRNAWNAEAARAMGSGGARGDLPVRHPRDVVAGRPLPPAAA
jgi:hypothetical protein